MTNFLFRKDPCQLLGQEPTQAGRTSGVPFPFHNLFYFSNLSFQDLKIVPPKIVLLRITVPRFFAMTLKGVSAKTFMKKRLRAGILSRECNILDVNDRFGLIFSNLPFTHCKLRIDQFSQVGTMTSCRTIVCEPWVLLCFTLDLLIHLRSCFGIGTLFH